MLELTNQQIKSYRFGELIGAGGFAAVYEAHQDVINRNVAVKIIWPAFANHPNFIRRFEAEAQVVASLEHPYIVPLYDYWREPTGAYIVMRLMRGGHLRNLLMDQPQLDIIETVSIVRQIGAGLAHAHQHGVVHRDLKPENILLDEQRNAYLADFGIAQIIDSARPEDDSTLGSTAYAAPEQLRGEDSTPATDLYSLAIMIFEMITGEHPFPEAGMLSTTEALSQRETTPLASVTSYRDDIPQALDAFLQKAAALDAEARFTDAKAFVSAFQTALGQRPLSKLDSDATRIADSTSAVNPYKGLRPFQEHDSAKFFGRETIIQQVIDRLRTDHVSYRCVTIVGPSGSGKSSIARAGVLPMLRKGGLPGSEHWFYVDMMPGKTPFEELAAALLSIAADTPSDLLRRLSQEPTGLVDSVNTLLTDADAELVILIDQFEEIFTLVDDVDQRDMFLQTLHYAATATDSHIRLILTLRADFYDRPLRHPVSSDLLQDNTQVVAPMSHSELEAAIIRPAEQVGVEIEAELVATIVAQLQKQPGVLPLLQFTLSELFEQRQGNVLTLTTYEQIGQLNGALARRADVLYDDLDEPQQQLSRQIFLRLITLGEGTEDTRRRVLLGELTAINEDTSKIRQIIDHFVSARLLTFDADPITRSPTIEVAHEALIREWSRLRQWLDDSREDIRLQRSLDIVISAWQNADNDPSFLLHGNRLDRFLRWQNSTNLTLTSDEIRFLQSSLTERARLRTEEARRVAHLARLELRSGNRLRLLVGVLLAAVLIAAVLIAITLRQSQIVSDERNRAEQARATSDANAAMSQGLALSSSARQAQSINDGDLAVALAIEAARVDPSGGQTWRTLAEIALSPGTKHKLDGHISRVSGVSFSPDGQWLASSSWDGTIRIWDVDTGNTVQILEGHRGDIEAVDFSDDGQYLLSGGADFAAIVWDITTGEIVQQFSGHSRPIRTVAFLPTGNRVLTGSSDERLILWDINSGEEVRRFEGHASDIRDIAISPDGKILVSNGRDAIVWDVERGEIRHQLVVEGTIHSVAVNSDGSQVAMGSEAEIDGASNGVIHLWQIDGDAPILIDVLESAAGKIERVRFVDDQTLVVGTGDNTLEIWDVQSAAQRGVLNGHLQPIISLDVSSDGQMVATGSLDNMVRVWNIGTRGEIGQVQRHSERITGATFASESQLITAAIDWQVFVWDPMQAAGTALAISAESAVRSVSASINGEQIVLGLQNGNLMLYNMLTNTTQSLTGDGSAALATLITPNSTIFAGTQNGTILSADPNSTDVLSPLATDLSSVFAVESIPNTEQLLVATRSNGLLVIDRRTGQPTATLEGHDGAILSLDINDAGTHAASGSIDNTVIIWDLATFAMTDQFTRHSGPVWSVAFSPDGRSIISGSDEPIILLWDVSTLDVHQQYVPRSTPFSLAFSPNGRFAVSGENSGLVQLWHTFDLPELVEWASNNRYIREFTCTERITYQLQPCSDD